MRFEDDGTELGVRQIRKRKRLANGVTAFPCQHFKYFLDESL
jgi:hypothetical protein